MNKKVVVMFLMALIFCFVSTVALAGITDDIMDKVNSNSETAEIVEQADELTEKVVEVARGFGILGLLIFGIWAGYGLAVAPQGQGMAAIKGRAVAILFFGILVFRTEDIAGFFLKLIGYTG